METHTLDTRGTGTVEGNSIAGAGATSPTGLRLTGISSETLAALGATPARITNTAEPEREGSQGQQVGRETSWGGGAVRRWEEASPSRSIMADTVTAGFLGTGMACGEAQWGQGARWAEAAEAIFPIHTGASLAAWAGRTLVDLHIAKGP